MARAAITLRPFNANSNLADPTPDTIDQANGMKLALKSGHERVVLRVKNTAGAGKVVTVKGGESPSAQTPPNGDLAVTVAAGATQFIGPFTSGRFAQLGGDLLIDFASGTTGEITAFQIPRRF
jgi:hypothetical protein